jgi:hypothetical protein
MQTDRYTKLVLTVIAIALVWLCAVTTRWPAVSAQASHGLDSPVQPVVIVGWGTMDAKGKATVVMTQGRSGVVSDPNVPVKVLDPVAVRLPPDPVAVRLEYSDVYPLPVGLTSIKRTGEWEPIRSAVEGEPMRPKPGR